MQLNKDTFFVKDHNVYIDVKKFLRDIDWVPTNLSSISKWNYINSPSLKRVGLELVGINTYNYENFGNIIVWGYTEYIWFKTLSSEELTQKLNVIFNLNPPLIILSKSIAEPIWKFIIEKASIFSIPVIRTEFSIAEIHTYISPPLSEVFASSVSKHASLVEINGIGVMIIGESGVGKSEAVLELVQKRYIFISDDTVIVKRIGNSFYGYPSEITKGILEIRGLGLIDIDSIYGKEINRNRTEIRLVVELVKIKSENKEEKIFDRLGNQNLSYKILGSKIPRIQIPVQAGRSASSLIIAATNLYIAKSNGINALNTIIERWGE